MQNGNDQVKTRVRVWAIGQSPTPGGRSRNVYRETGTNGFAPKHDQSTLKRNYSICVVQVARLSFYIQRSRVYFMCITRSVGFLISPGTPHKGLRNVANYNRIAQLRGIF